MQHVTIETGRRLKDAGFPQPEKPEIGQAWLFSFLPDTVLVIGSQVEGLIPWGGLFHAAETFLPTATDIMQHLPGWNLCYQKNEWVAWADLGTDREPEYVTFENDNPAESVAEAWFFEQATQKK